MSSRPPRLTEGDLGDDSTLASIIEGLITSDKTYWKHCRAILPCQLRHQELSSEDGFEAQLAIEQAWEARDRYMMLLVARWAFMEGRRSSNE